MKKFLKITGIFLGIIFLLLLVSPLFFKGTLEKLALTSIEKNIDAKVSWSDFDVSLFRSFPDAALTIKDFSIVNNAPFQGDTLASVTLLKLDMGITQLFKKGDDPIKVNGIFLDNALVNIKVDSLGNSNYNIAKTDAETSDSETSTASDEGGFKFDLEGYELQDSRINYLDASSKTFLTLQEVNHKGAGDFSLSQFTLDTKTQAVASFKIENISYLTNNTISLDAELEVDLENQKYTFLENAAKINELPLTFDGFVQVNEANTNLDLSFKTPSSSFKNFLVVIPKVYVKDIKDVTTTGDFVVDGKLQGLVDDTHIPKMDIKISSSNASFKYPELPKAVQNISINAQLKNETGIAEDTFITIGGLTFKIDDELFSANGSIRNLTNNALINLVLKGTVNLTNIKKVLPIELNQELSGVFKADITTNFDMYSIEHEKYQNIKSSGTASLSDFKYTDEAFKNELQITNAAITFVPNNIKLTTFDAVSGKTDISATGTIQNLIPWIMAKEDLKGRFNVASNIFNVNDFMASETSETPSEEGAKSSTAVSENAAVKIPDFLDATLDFKAKKVIYDNITLTDAKGIVGIKDEAAILTNVTSEAFGGNLAFSGNVSTKTDTPKFAMNLDLKKIDIGQSFQQLELLKYIAPIAKALDGDINTTLALEGDLTNELTPKLSTIAGNALAQVLTAKVNYENTPLLSKLGEQITFLDLNNLDLSNLSTAVTFNNGNIEVAPFDFDVKGIKVNAKGSHGLDKSINYTVTMDVPAKKLGGEVSSLLAKLSPEDANSMSVSLPVGISGTLNNPSINVDTKSAVSALTQKLIEKQKQDLIDKGTNILDDLIGGNQTPKDSTDSGNTNTQNTTQVVTDILGGLFGNKKNDSTKTGN